MSSIRAGDGGEVAFWLLRHHSNAFIRMTHKGTGWFTDSVSQSCWEPEGSSENLNWFPLKKNPQIHKLKPNNELLPVCHY